ncbi:DNA polymerase I [Nymphaea thermarum]|nr:DNA polymerase I [Nymphaea thermarum]
MAACRRTPPEVAVDRRRSPSPAIALLLYLLLQKPSGVEGRSTVEGLTFRHTLFAPYKSNRIPTPDTIVQGLQYLKASIRAMSINIPGVEADDVIGTLAVNSVAAGCESFLLTKTFSRFCPHPCVFYGWLQEVPS